MQLIDLYKVLDENVEVCIYSDNSYSFYFFACCPEDLLYRTVKKIYISHIRYIVAELEDDI